MAPIAPAWLTLLAGRGHERRVQVNPDAEASPQMEITSPQAHRSLTGTMSPCAIYWRVRQFRGASAYANARHVGREVNRRVDIILVLIAELVRLNYELPTFGALIRIAEEEHAFAEQELYTNIERCVPATQRRWLDDLLPGELPRRWSWYNDLKRSAKKVSRPRGPPPTTAR